MFTVSLSLEQQMWIWTAWAHLLFSIANTTVLHGLRLVESTDEKPQIGRNWCNRGISYIPISHCAPDPHIVQGSTVLDFLCCNRVAVTSICQLLGQRMPSLVSPTPDTRILVKALFLISASLKHTWPGSFCPLSQEPTHSSLPQSSPALFMCQVPLPIHKTLQDRCYDYHLFTENIKTWKS